MGSLMVVIKCHSRCVVLNLTLATGNTYRRKITDLQSGNRGRDSEIMGGLLDKSKSMPKVERGRLNAHSDFSDNLCACSRIQVTSRNGCH